MNIFLSLILTLAIVGGQLVKIPIGSGGATLLDITVIVFCLIGLIQIKLKLLNPPFFIKTGLVFGFIALVSLILTPLNLTLPQYFSSALYIVRFLSIILLGWLLSSKALPKVKEDIRKILLLSGVSFSILGLLQFIFLPDIGFIIAMFGWDPHYFRTVSTFLDPNFAGAFFVLTLLLLKNSGKSKMWGVYFVITYLALLTTFSRSSYLAFLISFMTLTFLQKSLKIGILTAVLFAGLLVGFSLYQKDVAQPRGIDRVGSAESRFSTWHQGLLIFQIQPILGVGFNAYRYALEQYDIGKQEFLSSRGSSTNDSSLLYVAATTGIVGLISFLLFLFSIIKFNTHNPVLIAGLLGLIIQSFFANILFYPFILIWIILSAVYNPCYTKKSEETASSH